MRRWVTLGIVAGIALVIGGGVFAYRLAERERLEEAHYEREETMLVVANLAQAPLRLFKSRRSIDDPEPISGFEGSNIWLPIGDYFVEAELRGQNLFYPVTVLGYRSGPDSEGTLALTIRQPSARSRRRPRLRLPTFVFIPSGSFVIGDRRNPRASRITSGRKDSS